VSHRGDGQTDRQGAMEGGATLGGGQGLHFHGAQARAKNQSD